MPEARRSVRHEITVPVDLANSRGHTRDVSISGVSIEAAPALPVGAAVEMTIHLRSLEQVGLALHCIGRVVRVENASAGCRVAATIDEFDFAATASVPENELDH